MFENGFSMLTLLAQAATGPATRAANAITAGTVILNNTTGGSTDAKTLHAPWEKWLSFYNFQLAVTAITTFAVLVLSYILLSRIFKRWLDKYRLQRVTAWGAIAAILYFTLLAAHPLLMTDEYDVIALTIHKTFAAILLIVGLRYLDRLVILPLLTRITGGPPSRFIHQIIMTVISAFVVAGYCSWAFKLELGPLLTGSAVISIVLGLALQETLGNFFSGMVLQASVPFQPGDWIQIGAVEGRVVEMTWRAVTLITGANNYVLIPNSSVAKEQIVNYHCPSVATATNVSVGLDYSLAPNEAKKVLIQAAKDTPGVLSDPKPGAALVSFDESSILYKINFWINEPKNHGTVEEAVRVNLWYRLSQAGYGIPFPVRTVEMADLDKKQAATMDQSRAARLQTIRGSAMFSEMAPELQEKLAAETRSYGLGAGQVFYRQGDSGDSMFILESGAVEITLSLDGKEVTVTEFEAPAVFGEVSAVTGQPRAATYRVKRDARVIEVEREHLQGLFTQDPRLMDHFSQLVAERQKQRDELLKKAGASHAATNEQSHDNTVLDRMKRLFTFGHR